MQDDFVGRQFTVVHAAGFDGDHTARAVDPADVAPTANNKLVLGQLEICVADSLSEFLVHAMSLKAGCYL
jgi:hypothetical protein